MTAWQRSNVLVTGAGGFIGSHLVERLVELGANVTAFVRYNSRNDPGLLELVGEQKGRVRVVPGEITELETVCKLVDGAEVVFHLAALVGIPYSYVHPNEVFEVNAVGTLNVLTAARTAKPRKVVVTSTSEVYGTARQVPMDETHPKQPQSPYAASKIAGDAMALSFHRSYELPVAIVRPFNTYGPRQSDRAIIPTIIAQALTNREIKLGNTAPTRDFTYVTDTVEGFIKAAESEDAVGEEMNLGCGEEISIGDLANKIAALVGREVKTAHVAERARPESSEVMRLLSDNSKVKRLTGWAPRVDLERGLSMTIDWMKDHLGYYDPGSYRI